LINAQAAAVDTGPDRSNSAGMFADPVRWRLLALIFLPFAFGYYLSYLFRTINALISSELISEFSVNAAELGLITSVYFLTFAVAQLPLGVLLDRVGPRKVQTLFLLIAAAGAALFGSANGFAALIIGRGLIGLGVAASLMAGLKAIVLWFPKERIPLVNGWFIMFGALGAVTATAPAELLLPSAGWRGLYDGLSVATAASALLIYAVVPEQRAPQARETSISLMAIYKDGRFQRLAPLSALLIGTAWSMQGLWAAPWFMDVEKLDHHVIVLHLFAMAVALCTGALLMGLCADRLRRRGVRPETLLATVAAVFLFAQLTLVLGLPVPPYVPWCIISAVGAATVLSYAIIAECFPKEITGQANAALNVLHIGSAFIVQCAIGTIVEHWTPYGGHYPPVAYKTAFALNIVLQLAALAWFRRLPRKHFGTDANPTRVILGSFSLESFRLFALKFKRRPRLRGARAEPMSGG
jgi:MFS family permease